MKQIGVGIIGTGWCGGIRAETCAAHPLVKSLAPGGGTARATGRDGDGDGGSDRDGRLSRAPRGP